MTRGGGPRAWPPDWLAQPETAALIGAFAAAGLELRFVGGAVRDALLEIAGGDIDIATPAPPDAVLAALARAKIRAVPTGLAHGTVTAVIGPHRFEITTLRRDVETDGRHAVVAFDAGWEGDAARRDFTINAIYLAPDGTLYDPVGGCADLAMHRVRFVGDASRRIAEDVLRLLRYYRFEARYGAGSGDAEARAACRAAVPLLPTLSAERVAHELVTLLAVPDPLRALRLMQEDRVLAAVLPEATRLDRLERLLEIEPVVAGDAAASGSRGRESAARARRSPPPAKAGRNGDFAPDPILRLAALVSVDAAGAIRLAERLRLSAAERRRLAGLAPPWPLDPAGDERAQRRALYRLGRERYRDLSALIAAEGAMTPARLADLSRIAAAWAAPAFPLSGDDVTTLGIAPGPRVGRLLAEVREWWEAGDFAADRARCLVRLREIAAVSRDAAPP